MGTVLNEGTHTGEFLLSEGEGYISRESITALPTAVPLASGTLMGKVTASGKYKPYNNANADGSEVVAAILYTPLPISATDTKTVGICRLAEVSGAMLVGNDAPALADLKLLNILVR